MRQGFFTPKQTQSLHQSESNKTLSCVSCGMYRDVLSPKMKPFGNFKKRILNIGEAPGETEDRLGKQWQGKVGQLLQRTYKNLGIDLFEDCLNINACNCRPVDEKGNNRTPTNTEIECCRKFIFKAIHEYAPDIIIVLGGSALYSILGHRWKGNFDGIMKWRGWKIPDRDLKSWVCPVFHPSFVERSEKEVMTIWKQDLEQIFHLLRVDFPKYTPPEIEIIDDLKVLKSIGNRMISFDYETTGIKPHGAGHRIICASVAFDENRGFAFMMPERPIDREPFIELLSDITIDKMAHNMKFEDTWSKIRLRTDVNSWIWDSMIAAHVLDNRKGVTGLKFQAYVNFGVIDYSSEISPYLRAVESKNGNSLNRIHELISTDTGKDMLLKYCGWDSVLEYRLAMKQMNEMNYEFLPF